MKKYLILFGFFSVISGITLFLGSCDKKEDTIARVTVRDTSNAVVANARVILYGVSTETPVKPVNRRDTVFTDKGGVAVFYYNDIYQLGQAGVAILNITAEKGNLKGEGIIKIESETENTATVIIQP